LIEKEMPELNWSRSHTGPNRWSACVAKTCRAQALERASIAVTTRATTTTVELRANLRRWRDTRRT
jgi:hypothetical protein